MVVRRRSGTREKRKTDHSRGHSGSVPVAPRTWQRQGNRGLRPRTQRRAGSRKAHRMRARGCRRGQEVAATERHWKSKGRSSQCTGLRRIAEFSTPPPAPCRPRPPLLRRAHRTPTAIRGPTPSRKRLAANTPRHAPRREASSDRPSTRRASGGVPSKGNWQRLAGARCRASHAPDSSGMSRRAPRALSPGQRDARRSVETTLPKPFPF